VVLLDKSANSVRTGVFLWDRIVVLLDCDGVACITYVILLENGFMVPINIGKLPINIGCHPILIGSKHVI